ncbi:toprim domain-containing protein [Flavobacterium sp. TMP13]|uniref:toprim domain-containing protein n=1 Tax=Flavobacterium sp. TMP13 TaxID=3425950 RepID=UPI003D77F51B
MNTNQAKLIPIEIILNSMGFTIIKEAGNDLWFISPFYSAEKTASFHVHKQKNYWYCFSTGFGGNTVDLIIKLEKCTVSEALTFLQNFDSFSFQKQIISSPEIKQEETDNKVIRIIKVQHIALKQYLTARCITKTFVKNQIKEIHYEIHRKKYFAIGFKNRSDGWELRSKYAKICLGKKDVTLITTQSNLLRIFEGVFDFLSFLEIMENDSVENSDYLILNSAALIVKNIEILDQYNSIELYLDNDTTGDKYSNFIKSKFINTVDFRCRYKDFKDLNEWLIDDRSKKLND